MTSSKILVSLCVIRIEISDPDSEETAGKYSLHSKVYFLHVLCYCWKFGG